MQQIFLAYTKYLCGQHGLSNIIYDLSLNMTKLQPKQFYVWISSRYTGFMLLISSHFVLLLVVDENYTLMKRKKLI